MYTQGNITISMRTILKPYLYIYKYKEGEREQFFLYILNLIEQYEATKVNLMVNGYSFRIYIDGDYIIQSGSEYYDNLDLDELRSHIYNYLYEMNLENSIFSL